MFALGGWGVEEGPPLPSGLPSQSETLRWQDPFTSLTVWHLCEGGEGMYRLRQDGLIVDVFPGGRIVSRAGPNTPQITVDHFLADQVFPRLLAHAGEFVVHAGAVRTGKSAVMLVGISGRGKSTLSASFDQAGFELLGDDAMILSSDDGVSHVRAVYRSLRLFPDSVDALLGGVETAGPIAHYSSKQRIDVAGDRDAERSPLRINAIFSIAAPAQDDRIVFRRLSVAEACMTLVENSFALDPADLVQARGRLRDASALARQVPAFEIAYPRDYSRLPGVRQAILKQINEFGLA